MTQGTDTTHCTRCFRTLFLVNVFVSKCGKQWFQKEAKTSFLKDAANMGLLKLLSHKKYFLLFFFLFCRTFLLELAKKNKWGWVLKGLNDWEVTAGEKDTQLFLFCSAKLEDDILVRSLTDQNLQRMPSASQRKKRWFFSPFSFNFLFPISCFCFDANIQEYARCHSANLLCNKPML